MSFTTIIVSFYLLNFTNGFISSTNACMLLVMCNLCWSLYAGPCEPVTDGGASAGSFTLFSPSNYTLHDLTLFQRALKQGMTCIHDYALIIICVHTNCTQSHFKAQRLKSYFVSFSRLIFWLVWAGWASATGSWMNLGGRSFCTRPMMSKLPHCGLFLILWMCLCPAAVFSPLCFVYVCVLMNVYVSLTLRTTCFSLRLRADL